MKSSSCFTFQLTLLIKFVISGKSLEDLRGSLFSKFRTPEGAKRQQQRSCGPSVALTFNFFVAVSIIFMNKLVGIPMPI